MNHPADTRPCTPNSSYMPPGTRSSPPTPYGLAHEAQICFSDSIYCPLLNVRPVPGAGGAGLITRHTVNRQLLLPLSRSVVSNSFVTRWAVARQVPLSVEFPRQESWSGLSFPSPGDLPDPGSNPYLLLVRQFLSHCTSWESREEADRPASVCV